MNIRIYLQNRKTQLADGLCQLWRENLSVYTLTRQIDAGRRELGLQQEGNFKVHP